MKRIVLASASVQRRKLLANLHLPFTVHASQSDEITKIKTTCARLVEDNALLKARDIASKEKDAIVIGADTVVYLGGKKLLGKPKSLKEAKEQLHSLFHRPQWVYTGVAVIDSSTRKEIVGYEKTKVFMVPLSDEEIERYHQKISPLDKAGSFDIEGWGSLFINRIEGCYTNVIGLPMAKLSLMLKKCGISILSMSFAVFFVGCTSEYNLATEKQERYIFDTDKEVEMGSKVAAAIEEEYAVVPDMDINERVENILKRIVAVCDRKDVVYFVKVLDEDLMNAISLPGGYVYIFKGIVDKLKTDDELAGVIAHEVGHITAKHGIKRLQNSYAMLFLQVAASQSGNGAVARGVSVALTSVFTEYSQQAEFEADELGIKYMKLAGYDPTAMVKVLQVLREEQDKEPARPFSYWRTHPHMPQRIANVNQTITGKLEFRDYLNLITSE
jgi:septum formation protein